MGPVLALSHYIKTNLRDLLGRKSLDDLVVEQLLVGHHPVEILEVDLVEPFRDEDHMGHHHLLDGVAFGPSVAKDLGLIELPALGNLVPNLLQVGLLIFVESLEQVIIELRIIDEFLNSKGCTLSNEVLIPEGGSANLMRDILVESMNLLVQLLFDDEIGTFNNLIEDGDFLGYRLLEADFLEDQADVLIIGSVIHIVALVEDVV